MNENDSNQEFNGDNLPEFVLHNSFLDQLFEFSGSTDGNKGFLLAFVNQNGSPVVYTKADNQIIEMGLRTAIERYIIESEESELYKGNDPI